METVTVPAENVTDVSDPYNLVVLSTNIFTGRVDDQSSAKALGSMPETQYRVTTGLNVKGTAPQTVTLNQQGGRSGDRYISFGGDRPLASGQWYLFFTRYLARENWHTVIPVQGHKPLTPQDANNPASVAVDAVVRTMLSNPDDHLRQTSRSQPPLTFPTPTPGQVFPPPSSPQPR
ncbi:MAG: hypothetical protein INR66_03010 [Gordonia polyisoprenivorans]|nr:hypothetical protein [Gordonia polyisoprenivorans]